MREIALWENPMKGNWNLDEILEYGGASYKQHFVLDAIEELQKNPPRELVIWGTYANANSLRKYLKKKYSVQIDACVVNRKYIDAAVNIIREDDDFPLVALEDYIVGRFDVDIIIDFSFYKHDMLAFCKDNINRVFVGDFMGSFIFGRPYIIDRKMYSLHRKDFRNVCELLTDVESKKEYIEFIQQKIFGFYNKKHHKVQYFDPSLITMRDDEVFLDVGAYNGDTVQEFIQRTHDYRHIYCIEMDPDNYEKLQAACANVENITLINKAVGRGCGTAKAVTGNNSASYILETGEDGLGDYEIESLDHMIEGEVTFIKMDIEGYELDALKGGENIIQKYKPALAICLYHKIEDLWTIPEYIKELCPDYKLYFRNYHNSASECVLYAFSSFDRVVA